MKFNVIAAFKEPALKIDKHIQCALYIHFKIGTGIIKFYFLDTAAKYAFNSIADRGEGSGPKSTAVDEIHFNLTAGMLIVVPQGCWHRFQAPDGVTVLSATPQPTDHSIAENPRVAG